MTDQHTNPKSDIEIAQAATMKRIADVASNSLGIDSDNLEPYGHYKAKLSLEYIKTLKDRPDGKLILVTAMTPTPAGEGKTTTTVGLGDGLNKIGKNAVICIREASLGPNFGMKGGCGWRLCASRADDRHQPAFHRGLPRHRRCQQPAGSDGGQPYLLGQ